MKRYSLLTLAAALLALCASAQSKVQKSMLDTFVKYAKIDSQSCDSIPWPCTPGQMEMAHAIESDVAEAIAKSKAKGAEVAVSPDGYVYVHIPSNIKAACPSLGFSCHLDLTPEAKAGNIVPTIGTKDGHTIITSDGTTLLGADDKCGVTISVELIRTILADNKIKHGQLMFAFCPNEDVGHAADKIDPSAFSPDILFDLDGENPGEVTRSNFTARGFNVRFVGKNAHPGHAKEQGLGDAIAAASTFVAYFPVECRPENSEGLQGYIHPWSFEHDGKTQIVNVSTRVRYFDKAEGEKFDRLLREAMEEVKTKFPNVKPEILYDGIQYENVAYTLYPGIEDVVIKAAGKIGMDINFVDERGGTTAAMMAARGLKGGMCLFAGMHDVHSTREWADLQEMEEAYALALEIIKEVSTLKK